ncbi:MAG: MATE family efflux transporter [Myxococcales bacterium]|nr:MATE family efflux transporter [Myxococcales bacterium]
MPAPSARVELAAQARLATPLAAQQVGMVVMGVVDTALLGHHGAAAMAGAGIATGLVFALSCIGTGVIMGLDPLIAQAIGAGDAARTPGLLAAGLRVAVRLGLLLTLVVLATPLVLDLAGVERDVAEAARVYVFARSIGIIPALVQVALRAFLQAHGVTRPMVVAAVVGNVVNALLDWILIFGDAGLADLGLPAIGLPAMGVLGAALATTAVTLAMLAIYAGSTRAVLRALPGAPPDTDPVATERAIVRVGLPIGLQLFAEVGAFALAAVLAGRLGTVPAAAHQVAIQLASVPFAISLGIGAAAATRVGLAVGAGDRAWARRAALVSLGLGALVMSTSALAFVLAPELLAAGFGDRAEVTATAATLIQIAAVFQLSDGAQAIASGALRGAGDTRAAFVANVIGHYAVGLPIALVAAFTLARGAAGLWWGLTAGLTGTAIVLVARLAWLTARPIARAALR